MYKKYLLLILTFASPLFAQISNEKKALLDLIPNKFNQGWFPRSARSDPCTDRWEGIECEEFDGQLSIVSM
jgi:hypothetical protein